MSRYRNHKKNYQKLPPIIAKREKLLQIVRFQPYLSRNKLKVHLFAHTQVIYVTPTFLHKLKTEFYSKKVEKHGNFVNCSLTDYMIARIAKELQIPVISFDQHLSVALREMVDYDAIWPHDLQIFRPAKQYLVDTNIIWGIISEINHIKHQAIMEMFQNNAIEFIIPLQVLDELVLLLERQERVKSMKKHNMNHHINRINRSSIYSKYKLKAF